MHLKLENATALALVLQLFLAGCGGGGSDSTATPPAPNGGNGPSPQAPPSVSLAASSSTVPAGATVTLTWSSLNASSCSATGGWAGARATSGSETVGPLSSSSTFGLSCSGTGGSTLKSVEVAVQPVSPGVASSSRVRVAPSSMSRLSYEVEVDLTAFDPATAASVSIQGLRTGSTRLGAPGSEKLDLGEQRYSLKRVSCDAPSASGTPYQAVALLDRGSPVGGQDASEEALQGLRDLVARMSAADRLWPATFPGNPLAAPPASTRVFFYGSDFSSDRSQLASYMNAISLSRPNGSRPLWDAAQLSVEKFTPSASGQTDRALIVYSRGFDDASRSSSPSNVAGLGLARGVKIHVVQLRDSYVEPTGYAYPWLQPYGLYLGLENVAYSTGGSFFASRDPKALTGFVATLGKVMSAQASKCTAVINVQFVPDRADADIGYGPGANLRPTLEFLGTSSAGLVSASMELTLPLSPGAKIGQTARGSSVYESDVLADRSFADCLHEQGTAIVNKCSFNVFAAVCDATNPVSCMRGLLAPGTGFSKFTDTRYASCPAIGEVFRFEPVLEDRRGLAGSWLYTSWAPIANANSNSATCVNAARGPF